MEYKLTDEERFLKEGILQEGLGFIEKLKQEGWGGEQINMYLRSLMIKSPKFKEEVLKEKILKRLNEIQPGRNKQKIREILDNFSYDGLERILDILLARDVTEIREVLRSYLVPTGKGLFELLRLLEKGELDKIENLFSRYRFARLILQEKFKEKESIFPSLTLTVKSAGRKRHSSIVTVFCDGRYIAAYLNKRDFPIGSEVGISAKGFSEELSTMIFQISLKEKPHITTDRIVEKTNAGNFTLVPLNKSFH